MNSLRIHKKSYNFTKMNKNSQKNVKKIPTFDDFC